MLTLITTIRISTTRRTMSTSTGWMLTKYSSSLRATGRSAMMERRYNLISSLWTMIAMSLMMLGFSTSTNRRPSLCLRRRSVSEDSGQLEVIYFLVAQLIVINSRPEILMLLTSATSESWTSLDREYSFQWEDLWYQLWWEERNPVHTLTVWWRSSPGLAPAPSSRTWDQSLTSPPCWPRPDSGLSGKTIW